VQEGFGWSNGVTWRWLPEAEVLALQQGMQSRVKAALSAAG
jgi:hypothetical protein